MTHPQTTLPELFQKWLSETPLTTEDNGYTTESLQWAFEAGASSIRPLLESEEMAADVAQAIWDDIQRGNVSPGGYAMAAIARVIEVLEKEGV